MVLPRASSRRSSVTEVVRARIRHPPCWITAVAGSSQAGPWPQLAETRRKRRFHAQECFRPRETDERKNARVRVERSAEMMTGEPKPTRRPHPSLAEEVPETPITITTIKISYYYYYYYYYYCCLINMLLILLLLYH